jgi:hypothetical protein
MADTGEKVDFSQMDGANTDKVSELIRAKLGDIFGDQGFEEISVGGKQRRFRVTGTTLGVKIFFCAVVKLFLGKW